MRTVRRKISYFLVFTLLLFLFLRNAGRILVENSPQRSDVIVVLAGETDRRPARGLELLSEGYAPRMIIDVPAKTRLYTASQVELARNYIKSVPQAASLDICPILGMSTRDETHDVQRCLAGAPGSRVLIVTSDFHTRRALSIFRHELSGKTFSIAPAYDEAQFGVRWWTHREWAKTCFEEWLRLIWWDALERWK